ncbi:MAG: hypothetical protein IJJ33_09280, partial [Victivallales bacterium]|nr:hypothetical protein [Victivallales bacterium]
MAWTRGAPAELISLVEKLSAYKLLIPAHSPDASRNPVNFRFLRLRVGTRPLLIVSRIAFAGFDYTNRSNILAHHLFFDQPEEFAALPGGAAAICLAKGNFVTSWEGEPQLLEPRTAAIAPLPSTPQTWQNLAGDSNWGYLTAEHFLRHDRNSLDIEYHWKTADGQALLQLIAEAAAILPASDLPGFTFSTYYTQASTNAECFLRFCAGGNEPQVGQRPRNSTFFASLIQPGPCPQTDFPLVDNGRAHTAPLATEETVKNKPKPSTAPDIALRPLPLSRATPGKSAREGKRIASALPLPPSQSNQGKLRIALLLTVLLGGLAGVLVALQVGRNHTPPNQPHSPPRDVEPATPQPVPPPSPPPSAQPAIGETPIASEEAPQTPSQPSRQPLEALPPPGHLELTEDNELVYQPSIQETPYLDNLTVLCPDGQKLPQFSSQWQRQWKVVQEASRQFHQAAELRQTKQAEEERLKEQRGNAEVNVKDFAENVEKLRREVLLQLQKPAEQARQNFSDQALARLQKSWTPSNLPERPGGLPSGDERRRQTCNAELLRKNRQWDRILRDYDQDLQLIRSRICLELHSLLHASDAPSQLALKQLLSKAQTPVQPHLQLLRNVVNLA